MDPQILIELTKIISEQNENPVRIEKNLVQKNPPKDKTRSYNVQLGSSTLILSKTNNSQCSEAKHQKFLDQLDQFERQKKLYYQILETEEPLTSSKYGISLRSGELWKSGPGPRAKADARRHFKNRSRSSSPFVHGFIPQQTYCQYHKSDPPLSCNTSVKVSDSPVQGDGDNNQPPPEDTNFDASQYKGGPNLFLDKFDYDNLNHTRENTDFSSQKRMNHAYDRQAEKCFGIKESRNKENLKKFEGTARGFIESPETEKINGSYRYETPAYFYKEKDGNLVAIVNATDNSFITVVNATESQLNSIRDNKNFGLDTRPSMQLTLRLRGPKNQN